MCGIIGCIGRAETTSTILEGLDNLEYRGYDSAGMALKNGRGLEITKRKGEVSELKDAANKVESRLGIGHTRWSTHGPPTDENAHPHTDCTGRIAVVHNGIIDNHEQLRTRLQENGHTFTSDTDTEVIPHLIEEHLESGVDHETAFLRALEEIEGSYAIAMINASEERILASRSGSPLVVGVGEEALFLASDVPAFLEYTNDVIYVEDGDVVVLAPNGYRITDADGYHVDRPIRTVDWTPEDAEKGGFDHYMLKEINEQQTTLDRTLRGRIPGVDGHETVDQEIDDDLLEDVTSITFVACGTSYHAALYGEKLLASRGVMAHTVLASEFVANPPPMPPETLVVGVTQSGETADTLEALRLARERGYSTLAVTNVIGSTAARECDDALFIRAGPEIGVAATKTFSSQVLVLALLADQLDRTDDRNWETIDALPRIPGQVQEIIDSSSARRIAEKYREATSYFFVGRGVGHPVALEGALKLKEISYEHAEGFPAGELKHGPLALVTPETPVFAIITGEHEDRMRGTIEEVSARGAPVVAVTDAQRAESIAGIDDFLEIPRTVPELAGVLANVQLQLFSYHTATLLDRPVDKPRNLAKSVTVE